MTGVVLAGGQGRRLGGSKPSRLLLGRALIEYPLQQLRGCCAELLVVGLDRLPGQPVRCLADEQPGLGPLGGVRTALRAISSDWALVVAADMPLVSQDVVQALLRGRPGVEAVIPFRVWRGETVPEPTLALYHRNLLAILEGYLRSGHRRARGFVQLLRPGRIDAEAYLESFFNVNTPEDLARAERCLLAFPHSTGSVGPVPQTPSA